MGILASITSTVKQGFDRERTLVGNAGDVARKGALAGAVAATVGAQVTHAAGLSPDSFASPGDIAEQALTARLGRYAAREASPTNVGRAYSRLSPSEVTAPPATDGLKQLTRISNTGNRNTPHADGAEVTGRGVGRLIGGGRLLDAPPIPSTLKNFEPVT